MSITESDDLQCDVNGCETQVLGLSDGYEFSRGLVCNDCVEFHDDHGHWPDEDCNPHCGVPREVDDV